MNDPTYSISDARYAQGKVIIRTVGRDGYKQRACRLAGDGLGLSWVGRSHGYTASRSQVERFERLYAAGFDASWVTGDLDHTERGLRGLSWREADRMAKEWAATSALAGAESRSDPIAAQEGGNRSEALSGAYFGRMAA